MLLSQYSEIDQMSLSALQISNIEISVIEY
jgi:hypothetical protein